MLTRFLVRQLTNQTLVAHLLYHFGYMELSKGKTSESRIAFWNEEKDDIIRLHKPHPGNELKDYQRKLIKEHLIKNKWL